LIELPSPGLRKRALAVVGAGLRGGAPLGVTEGVVALWVGLGVLGMGVLGAVAVKADVVGADVVEADVVEADVVGVEVGVGGWAVGVGVGVA